MAVIIKYVVVRDGKKDMIFATKKEADAYDKMLDIAEQLSLYLQQTSIVLAEDQWEHLTLFMASHREPLSRLLKGERLQAATAATSPPSAASELTAEPVAEAPTESAVPMTDEPEAAKSSRARKSKVAA